MFPATGKEEIKSIVFQGNTRKKVSETPSQQVSRIWLHVSIFPAMTGVIGRRIFIQVRSWGKMRNSIQKTIETEKG
jgi:hypothetical protein